MDFADYLLIAICIILVYLVMLKFLERHKNKKDLDPNSKYPHEVLFKYFCLYVLYLSIFFGFGLVIGIAIILSVFVIGFLILLLFGALMVIDNGGERY